MDIFEKCNQRYIQDEVRDLGIYPYFHALESRQDTEVIMEGKRRIMLGSYLLSSGVYEKYYYPAQQVRTLITQDYTSAYQKCDVILAPASPRTAFKFGEISDPATMYLSDVFTISLNIAGNGGMSMPCGLGRETGLPIGVQLMSPQFKDENMFRVAMALEKEYGTAPVAPEFSDGKAGE